MGGIDIAAIRLQLQDRRQQLRLLWVVVLVAGFLALVGLGGLRGELLQALSPTDLRVVGSLLLAAVGILIPTAGIYSVVSQYAFWEGWLQGLPDPATLFSDSEKPQGEQPRRFVVYLDGIHQTEQDHPPRVAALLDELAGGLSGDAVLVRGLEAYTVRQGGLVEDAGSRWFWGQVFRLQNQNPNPLVQFLSAFLVQANNVIKVGISSDRRYGPIHNYELALKIATRLQELGFRPEAGSDLVLLGYSGGGEMAMGAADYLRRLCRTPVRIVTFCGVFGGNHRLAGLEGIVTIVGGRDPVAAFGNIAYPGRLPLLMFSSWNRAVSRGAVQRRVIEGMNHNGPRGPFSAAYRQDVSRAVLHALESFATGREEDSDGRGPAA